MLSWIRPGTLAENLSTKQLAIIDRATGQVILNDVTRGTVAPAPSTANVPEIQAALTFVEASAKELPPGSPPLGRQLIVMSSAHDDSGWYELIWPYNRRVGPSVVRLSNDGTVARRFRCVAPDASGSLHKIDVSNGYLVLASSKGEIYIFKL